MRIEAIIQIDENSSVAITEYLTNDLNEAIKLNEAFEACNIDYEFDELADTCNYKYRVVTFSDKCSIDKD